MDILTEHTEAIKKVLAKQQKLTKDDLQDLRERTRVAQSVVGKPDVAFRMDIELIDAIRTLDETSTKLITTTNTLTSRIFWLTAGLAFLGLVQLVVTIIH